MRVLEAKDFLVQQTSEQAALENVSLSDLEKRMMYFTETDECPEDPIALNDAFEAEYDTEEYEAKVSKLMHHAHSRIKKENPETARKWSEAIRELAKGDHYILILCGDAFDVVQGGPDGAPSPRFPKAARSRGPYRWPNLCLTGDFWPQRFLLERSNATADSPTCSSLGSTVYRCSHDRRLHLLGNSAFDFREVTNTAPSTFVQGLWQTPQNHARQVEPNYFSPTSFSNSLSLKIVTPSSFAFSYFDPGSVPTTT